MKVTLAEDDIRIKFPSYGLQLTNKQTFGKLKYMQDGVVLRTEVCIHGMRMDEKRLLGICSRASKSFITFYPYD